MEALNRWPKTSAALAILAIVGAAFLVVRHYATLDKRPKGDLWFYDLKSGELFAESDLSVPPIDTDSGPGMGVRAWVFSCKDCAAPKQRFIAYLEILNPAAKKAVEQDVIDGKATTGIGVLIDKHPQSVLVRAVEGGDWYMQPSPQGLAIMEAGRKKGGCKRPLVCLP